MPIANILILRGVNQLFSYEFEQDQYQIGDHVEIPFGRSKAMGVIMSIADQKTSPHRLKSIIQKHEKKPLLNADLVDLILWFQKYYQTTYHKAYQTIIGTMQKREIPESSQHHPEISPPYSITKEQAHVIETITQTSQFQKFLIHGVTASGKTEIYMQIAKKIITNNQQVIILVPEISLTPQLTQLFKDRFGDQVAVIHSSLTKKAREIEWNRIYENQAQIIIGPRSAIFAPIHHLGAIIIDEEHDASYKQENHPRYYTHNIAKYRCQKHHAKLIFGSATPCIETYSKTDKNITESPPVQLFTLKKRVTNHNLPTVSLINMQEMIQQNTGGIITQPLLNAIKNRIEKKEKVMILVNRRGYSTYISCQKCGEVLTCPKCHLSLTYHKNKTLQCHRCDITNPLMQTCPACQKHSLGFSGIGIQKVETELYRAFPNAETYRLDKDTAKNAKQIEKILTQFKAKGDILIGTQMIAKGHDIDSVTLVGVIGIDTVLNIPDFRSPERTFQLLTQVAGRAGRGKLAGDVYIQTYQPDHYAIQHSISHDFDSFYAEEIAYREALWYPSFSSLVNIIFSSENRHELEKFSSKINTLLQESFRHHVENKAIMTMGPKPAPIELLNGYYRIHILIKCQPHLLSEVKDIIQKLPPAPVMVRKILDFEPKSIL